MDLTTLYVAYEPAKFTKAITKCPLCKQNVDIQADTEDETSVEYLRDIRVINLKCPKCETRFRIYANSIVTVDYHTAHMSGLV